MHGFDNTHGLFVFGIFNAIIYDKTEFVILVVFIIM